MAELSRRHGVASGGAAGWAIAAALAIVVAACGGTTASPPGPVATVVASALGPTGSAGRSASGSGGASGGGLGPSAPASSATAAGGSVAGRDWAAAHVAQPQELVEPWASAQAPAFCSPCHAGVENALNAVAAAPGLLVAVGSSFPPSHAAAWSSADGLTWQQASALDAPDASLMTAVAAAGGRFAAVGGIGPDAAAWLSADGRAWSPAFVERPRSTGQARMAAVAAFGGGFVAGGDVEPGTSQRLGVVWDSKDGMTWHVASEGAQMAGGAVAGIAAGHGVIVAVGTIAGPDGTSAGAWYSADGGTWKQADAQSSTGAEMRAVVAYGSGFVAVGTAQAETHAAVWASTDGRRWTAVPEGDGFTNYGQRVAMSSVAGGAGGLVAVGERDSAGNGSATAWTSGDGTSWTRVEDPPSFSGGEMSGVIATERGFAAVGALGIPDNWASAAWISPPGG